ncbi:LysR family transcriptional regulator [Bacillus glycinifermentans]|uniref:LysR family transcriptional regulator n=1 Tax=Bacillus glycinifermentans TaxID=1664069 RepID=A0A0T6BLX5_9BACI|nr:LysR family transcriptional regulator [Bacillus glycinifermentans]ATH95132.1 LysR family transcriptional regulator [Bacillus glycinifermentans]KRT92221.1 LysR family transcriptional regulator [Bacillus glycinifermentans]MEC0487835.1 LysR family transcriptional regulator [Bacillus glycinifermentans]MEC0497111.1 LysR family transcriptional regulator [Bacillus glycinifermentans]MEC0542347.1 LysR family transcriptional regulator [Bacillus glycinifermentans]
MVMSMNHLHIFVKVAEKLNITEAAKELFISQPAVSKAIKNLENALDVRLFIRDKQNGLILTDVGKEILLLARQMMEIESKMHQVADRENKLLSGKVKIGSFPAVSTNLLPQAIAAFRAEYPLVHIELVEGTSEQIKGWVEDRTVDFGIVTSPFEPFDHQVLFGDYMVAVIPEQHAGLKDAALVNLKTYQHDMIFCKGGHEIAVSQTLEQHGIELRETLTVQNAETLMNMVKHQLGIGIISNFTLSSVSHELVKKDIFPRITREIGIIAHSFGETSPAAHEFIKVLSQCKVR